MTITVDKFKVKMDGQEHELNNVEFDNDAGCIYFDIDDTISVQVEDLQNLFDKEVEIMQPGYDDGYAKARIDSVYNDGESKDNLILGLSIN